MEVQTLDKTDKKIAELKKQNKSLREIAGEIGISHVAVKKRLDRMESDKNENTQPVNFDAQGRARVDDHPELLKATTEINRQLLIIAGIIEQDEFTLESPWGWKVEHKTKVRLYG